MEVHSVVEFGATERCLTGDLHVKKARQTSPHCPVKRRRSKGVDPVKPGLPAELNTSLNQLTLEPRIGKRRIQFKSAALEHCQRTHADPEIRFLSKVAFKKQRAATNP